MSDPLTPKDVALALGTSEASIKRWCDKGLIEHEKTSGGHRRIDAVAVVDFLRKSGRKVARPDVLGLERIRGRGPARDTMEAVTVADAIQCGSYDRLKRILLGVFQSGTRISELGDRLIAGGLHLIGQRWSHGEADTYEERRGLVVLHAVLHEIHRLLPEPPEGAPIAIGTALAGDPYSTSNMLVAATLRERGWHAANYGCDVPAVSFARAVRKLGPQLVWISTSVPRPWREIEATFEEVRRAAADVGASLVVGGRGVSSDMRREFRCAAIPETLAGLESFLDALASARNFATA